TVTGPSNTNVTWSIAPAGVGSIDATGLYTAPAVVASQQTVTVKALSQADSVTLATSTVTLLPISVTVTSSGGTVYAGRSAIFFALVSNASNTAVNWTISPSTAGSIDSTGFYTPPTTVSSPVTVIVTATSQADPSK